MRRMRLLKVQRRRKRGKGRGRGCQRAERRERWQERQQERMGQVRKLEASFHAQIWFYSRCKLRWTFINPAQSGDFHCLVYIIRTCQNRTDSVPSEQQSASWWNQIEGCMFWTLILFDSLLAPLTSALGESCPQHAPAPPSSRFHAQLFDTSGQCFICNTNPRKHLTWKAKC